MNLILLAGIIVLAVFLTLFFLSKAGRTKDGVKRDQEDLRRHMNEKVMSPERKLHEEEKKRWEDEYYRRR